MALLEKVFDKQIRMEQTLNSHTSILYSIAEQTGGPMKLPSCPPGWPKTFPIQTLAKFVDWEEFLNIDYNYQYAVDNFANKFVGLKYDDMTRSILKELFSKELKQHFNWMGTERKSGLKNSKTGEVIVDAVLCKFPVGKKAVGIVISKWLRNNLSGKRIPTPNEEDEYVVQDSLAQQKKDEDLLH